VESVNFEEEMNTSIRLKMISGRLAMLMQPPKYTMLSLLGAGFMLLLTACGMDGMEVRRRPDAAACMESRFVHAGPFSQVDAGISERPVTLELLQDYMQRPENLSIALNRKKYILHYFQRMPEWDQEIVPAKFPLYFEIDSTAMQTEGLFEFEFTSATQVQVRFVCETCERIDQQGQRLPGKRTQNRTRMDAATTSTQKNADWAFKLRPRKLQLQGEVGKRYLVQIESQESYLATAKPKLSLEADKDAFRLQFSDPFAYRAENFTKALCIAIVNSDQMARRNAIDSTMSHLKVAIDSLQAVRDALVPLQLLNGKSGEMNRQLNAAEKSLAQKTERLTYWEVQREAFIPRFLVIGNGMPCGANKAKGSK
jgi:hypothetical protein